MKNLCRSKHMTIREILDGFKPSEIVTIVSQETKEILYYGSVELMFKHTKYGDVVAIATIMKEDIKFIIKGE